MEYIVVKSQAELDAVPVDTDKIIRIEFGTTECPAIVRKQYRHFVNAYGNSTVEAHSAVAAYDNSTVKVYGNNIVIAWDKSTVEAYDKSTVEAWNNSTVEAWDNSTVAAWGNSTVAARENSTVAARGNSSVTVYGNSTVTAWGNVQICKTSGFLGKIKTHANARVVVMPKSVDEFLGFFGITSDESTAVLYKAVHKVDEGVTIKLVSSYDKAFEYKIGKKICSNGFDMNPEKICSPGIHVAHLDWALNFGADWNDLAILELKVNLADILVPKVCDGQVRVPEALVVREVPLEECGAFGRIIARKKHKEK